MLTLKLSLRFAFRDKVRTFVTAIAVGVTLVAFMLMRTLVINWYTTHDKITESDQFTIRHKVSISFRLSRHMEPRILSVPGVRAVSPLIWYSGNYQNEKTRFGQLAIDPKTYFQIYPQYAPPSDQLAQFRQDRSGAVVGPALAQRYGWRLGDLITLRGTLYPGNLTLMIRGIYSAVEGYNADWLFMHYDRLQPSNDHSHQLVVRATPEAARAIDALFADSNTPTKTESEHALRRSWASWSSAVVSAIHWGSGLILLILMLVLGNGLAMSVRDSTREHATMRALGFPARWIIGLVALEGTIVVGLGATLGLVATPGVLQIFSSILEQRLGGSWQLDLNVTETIKAAAVALLVGVLASLGPAAQVTRVSVVDALKKAA